MFVLCLRNVFIKKEWVCILSVIWFPYALISLRLDEAE